MVKTKTRKHRKLKKRRKSRKRIKTRRRRKLKYRGGGKNDELICHIIELIESIPAEAWRQRYDEATAELKQLDKKYGSTRRASIHDRRTQLQDILWNARGVKQLREWAKIPGRQGPFCAPLPTDEDEYEENEENRKPPRPP